MRRRLECGSVYSSLAPVRRPVWGTTWNRPGKDLIAGRSGIRRHPALDGESFLQDIAGMVDGLEGDAIWADRALSKLGARFLPLALRAAHEAWADAGLEYAH